MTPAEHLETHPAEKPAGKSHDGVNGVSAEVPLPPDEKHRSKKKLKKEAKRRREWLERFPPVPPSVAPTQPAEIDEAAEVLATVSPRRLREWYGIASRTLDHLQSLAAQKANTLIGVNALMLSAAGLCTSRVDTGSIVGWALIPLALTNVLSLAFAIVSAQVRQTTTLDELWAMPDDAYEQALTAIVSDKDHLLSSLRRDLHRAGANLNAQHKWLRTSYNVLFGGIPLAALMFGLCIAAASRT